MDNEPKQASGPTIDEIMSQAQVFASAWSLVGNPLFDADGGRLADADEAKARLRTMLAAVPDHSELHRRMIAAQRNGYRCAAEVLEQVGELADADGDIDAQVAVYLGEIESVDDHPAMLARGKSHHFGDSNELAVLRDKCAEVCRLMRCSSEFEEEFHDTLLRQAEERIRALPLPAVLAPAGAEHD